MLENTTTKTSRTLILLAHGSRNPATAVEVEALASNINAAMTDCEVHYAFLEMAQPSLPETIDKAISNGADDIDILPLFLNTGNHVVRDIPALISSACQQHPGTSIRLLRHLGAHEGYARLVQSIASEGITG